MNIEVVEIYPYQDKGKFIERGSVHIFIEDLGLDIKNIPYHINEEKTQTGSIYHVQVSHPFYLHKLPQEDGSTKNILVPTVSFRDKHIWKRIKKAIQKEVLEQLAPI